MSQRLSASSMREGMLDALLGPRGDGMKVVFQ